MSSFIASLVSLFVRNRNIENPDAYEEESQVKSQEPIAERLIIIIEDMESGLSCIPHPKELLDNSKITVCVPVGSR